MPNFNIYANSATLTDYEDARAAYIYYEAKRALEVRKKTTTVSELENFCRKIDSFFGEPYSILTVAYAILDYTDDPFSDDDYFTDEEIRIIYENLGD